MEECKHGLDRAYCSYCKDPRIVYVSGGGSAYHRSIDCRALEAGKEKVLDHGGELAHVTSTTQSNAEASGRRPCRTCASGASGTSRSSATRPSADSGREKSQPETSVWKAKTDPEATASTSPFNNATEVDVNASPHSTMNRGMSLSAQQRRVLELLAAGHSYDQILASSSGLSYLDIFESVQAAIDALDEPTYSVEEVRKVLPNAYRPWSEQEEAELRRRALRGQSMEEIASALGRSVGAVQSRLVKLFLDEAREE